MGKGLDLVPVVDLHLIQLVLERFELGRVGHLGQTGFVVIGLECPENILGIVDEIQHKRRVFSLNHAVEPGKGLD